jgi:hypothetical protein
MGALRDTIKSFFGGIFGGLIWKAFFEPVAIKYLRLGAKRYVPPAIDKFDPIMPKWIAELEESEIEKRLFIELLGMPDMPYEKEKIKEVTKQVINYYKKRGDFNEKSKS